MQEKIQSLQTTFRQETAAFKDVQQGQSLDALFVGLLMAVT